MIHKHNVRCVDGWHATVLYSTHDNPPLSHFDRYFPGHITEHEPAMEAPLHPDLDSGKHGPPAHWNAYVVRWKEAV